MALTDKDIIRMTIRLTTNEAREELHKYTKKQKETVAEIKKAEGSRQLRAEQRKKIVDPSKVRELNEQIASCTKELNSNAEKMKYLRSSRVS